MALISDFFKEIDEVFGFYFDIGMACHLASVRLETIQREHGISDDSPFMFKDGPPQDSPEQEMGKALHTTTISSVILRLGENGFDILKAAETVVVFVYHIWEEKYRGNLFTPEGESISKVDSDIMGDLRLLRNSIIHNKGFADTNIVRCKVITKFKPGEKIALTKSDMDMIVSAIKTELSNYS